MEGNEPTAMNDELGEAAGWMKGEEKRRRRRKWEVERRRWKRREVEQRRWKQREVEQRRWKQREVERRRWIKRKGKRHEFAPSLKTVPRPYVSNVFGRLS
jgi:hypothetical protein